MGQGRGGAGPGTAPRPAAPGDPGGSPGSPGGGGGGAPNPAPASPGGVQNPGGGGGEGGGGSTTPEPQPKEWYDSLRKIFARDNDPDSFLHFRNNTWVVNPRNQESKKWQVNCTRVAAAWELRRRGYDVEAGPKNPSQHDNLIEDITNKWRDSKGQERFFTFIPPSASLTQETFKEKMELAIRQKGGEGSRGFVRVSWKEGGGHIFNYEIRNGDIIYVEAQNQPRVTSAKFNGWLYDGVDDWGKDVDIAGHYNGIMRTDDLVPEERLVTDKWIYQRVPVEINAPMFDEMIFELDRAFPEGEDFDAEIYAQRQAFRLGWQKTRSNQNPRTPAEYKDIPELKEAYWQGVNWTRRPE